MTLTIIMFSHDVDDDDDVDVDVEHDASLIVLASKVLRWLRKKCGACRLVFCYTFSSFFRVLFSSSSLFISLTLVTFKMARIYFA